MTTYTIGEVARRTGMSIDTLRYYEREGLTPGRVDRDAGGRRRYTERDLEWLHVASQLRSTGMPIDDVRRYAELVRAGDATLPERIEMFQHHEHAVLDQIDGLRTALELIRHKVSTYREAAEEGGEPKDG